MYCFGFCCMWYYRTLLIGVLKEVADFMRGGSFDLKDMMADFVGSILGGFLVLLIL